MFGGAQEGGDECTHVDGSLCRTVETDTTLQGKLKWVIDSRSRGRETSEKTVSAIQLRLLEPERWGQKRKQTDSGCTSEVTIDWTR